MINRELNTIETSILEKAKYGLAIYHLTDPVEMNVAIGMYHEKLLQRSYTNWCYRHDTYTPTKLAKELMK